MNKSTLFYSNWKKLFWFIENNFRYT